MSLTLIPPPSCLRSLFVSFPCLVDKGEQLEIFIDQVYRFPFLEMESLTYWNDEDGWTHPPPLSSQLARSLSCFLFLFLGACAFVKMFSTGILISALWRRMLKTNQSFSQTAWRCHFFSLNTKLCYFWYYVTNASMSKACLARGSLRLTTRSRCSPPICSTKPRWTFLPFWSNLDISFRWYTWAAMLRIFACLHSTMRGLTQHFPSKEFAQEI